MSWWTDLRNTIEDVAPAAIGFMVGGPLGAAVGGGISGYAQTGHLGGTLEGAALGGLGGYLAAGAPALSSLLGGATTGTAGSAFGDAAGLLGHAPLTSESLGLATANAPGYVLPATGGSGLFSDLGASALGGLGSHLSALQAIQGLSQVYQGIQAQRNASALMNLVNQSTPLNQYRGQYAQQLQQLMQNPGSVLNLPGAQAGIEALNRDAAAKGYFGSGNQAAAVAQYGNQLYQQQLQNLAQLAGVNINPLAGASAIGSAGQSQASGLGLLSSGASTLMQ